MNCSYCGNEFITLSSLNNHIKTAQYCISKRNTQPAQQFKCKKCDKNFTSKRWMVMHEDKCGDNLQNIKKQNCELTVQNNLLQEVIKDQKQTIKDQKQTIKELQNKLENIAIKAVQKSTTTIKNTHINYIQKMEPITLEHLVNHVPQLTIEHIKKGASGYAEYALEGPLKDRIACVDYSRRKIKFKDIEGNVITDPEMTKLAPMFFDSIKDKSSQLVYNLNTSDMDSSMFEGVAKLFNTNADVKNGAIGIKTDFYHDFIKQVCSGSVVDN